MSLHTLTGDFKRRNKWVRAPDSLPRSLVHRFDPVAFIKAVYFLDVDKLQNINFSHHFFHNSLGVHATISDFGDGLYLANRYMSKKRFQMTEILEQAFSFVPESPLKKSLKDEMIMRRKEMKGHLIPPRDYYSKKVDAAERFFHDLGYNLKKYAPFFYLKNDNHIMETDFDKDRYRYLWVAKPQADFVEYDTVSFERALVQHDFSNQLALGKPVKFKIPVSVRAGTIQSASTSNDHVLKYDKDFVTTSSIVVGYHDGDDEVRKETDEFAQLATPRFLVEKAYLPFVEVNASYPLTNMIHDFTVYSELDIGIDLVWTRRHEASTMF